MIDASVWISFFHRQDRFYDQTNPWLTRVLLEGAPLSGPGLVLAEVAGGVTRITESPAEGRRVLIWLLNLGRRPGGLDVRTLTDQDEVEAARLACDLRLRGADSQYVVTALHSGEPLITWDEQLLERGRALVATGRPGEEPRRQ